MTTFHPSPAALTAAAAGVTVADLVAAFEAQELWRRIAGWRYDVSSWGNIRRVDTGRILRPATTKDYLHVTLSEMNVQENARVHRVAAEAFLGQPPFSDADAAHNDGDSHNNRIGNLRWATKLENQADRERHDTRIVGSAVFGAKLTEEAIPTILGRIAAGERYPRIATDYGVSVSTISLIKRGRIWRHAIPSLQAAE